MFIITERTRRAFALAAGLVLATGAGALYAEVFVEAFGWKNPPGVASSRTSDVLRVTMPLAILVGAVGAAVGLHTAADGRPYPAWRAAWRAVGLWVGIGILFALMAPVAVLFVPLCAGAAGLSGLAAAFVKGRGNHGQA